MDIIRVIKLYFSLYDFKISPHRKKIHFDHMDVNNVYILCHIIIFVRYFCECKGKVPVLN
jgi:hypothetical protein